MFAASMAFTTAMGYRTDLFVYGPGGYRLSDSSRAGAAAGALGGRDRRRHRHPVPALTTDAAADAAGTPATKRFTSPRR
jgi:hypothetical protein